jgi:hypothetical protein
LPEIGGERLAKKLILTWSLVDPAVASRKLRPKIVAALPVGNFLFIEVPRHLEGMWGGAETTI